ncbi:VOC family protein, partial [Candidatus Curtissbacteria bacterium]|nr:VOC family protein [Candidatus Curtissbacteria bacterium]
MKMNPVVHFEMPAEDRERMAKFYTDVFGWQTQLMGEEMANYVLAATTESDEKGQSKTPGAINGGFFEKKGDQKDSVISVVIQVDDIREHIEKVKAGGGTV